MTSRAWKTHPFTNDLYEPLEKDMEDLAWKWWKMLGQQTVERKERRQGRRCESEETWFSDKLYGTEGADEIQRWMEENHWNRP